MLEKVDYEAIASIVERSIAASETRMKGYMDGSIAASIIASETRMKDFVEKCVSQKIHESENRVLSEVDRVHISLQNQIDDLRTGNMRYAAN